MKEVNPDGIANGAPVEFLRCPDSNKSGGTVGRGDFDFRNPRVGCCEGEERWQQSAPVSLMTSTGHLLVVCRFLIGIVLVLCAGGCKSSSGGQSSLPPSGRAEVNLSARAKVKDVHAVAQDFFREREYVEGDSMHGYEFVFDKPMKRGRSGKALRVRLRLNKQPDGSWQLTGTALGVEGWRSELESETVVPQGTSQIQGFLVEIKKRLDSAR